MQNDLKDTASVVSRALGLADGSYGITIFIEGLSAGINGEDPRLCPYEKMTKEHAEWQRGQKIGCDLRLQ